MLHHVVLLAAVPVEQQRVLDAVCRVESGGRANCPDGDGGAAIGPFQVHRDYWLDSRVPGRYEDCRDRVYAERVVLAYWHRYAARALDSVNAEVLARVHNGGPSGARRKSTDGYWKRVERELSK